MKKESLFILAMTLFGVIAGAELVVVLMAIAVPSTIRYLLTVAEKADWDRMAEIGGYLAKSGSQSLLLVLFAAAALVTIALFLQVLNLQVKEAARQWKSRPGAKLLVVLVAAIAWFYLQAAGIDSLFAIDAGRRAFTSFLMLAGSTAALWLVAGEEGWAGDFSSWGIGSGARPGRTILLGAAAGAALFGVYQGYDWAFKKYFILVSEVLDGSGETSLLGYKQLAGGAIAGLGAASFVIAGFVVAFAPVRREPGAMKRRLLLPVGAFALFAVLIAAAYGYAGKRYDLDKPSLASALGVSDKAKESKTVLVLLPTKKAPVTIQEWPLKVSGWSLMSESSLELSRDNLQKVEAYLQAHPGGTVFTYAARDLLMKGYTALWDVRKGIAWQVKAAESQFIPRMLLVHRFRAMPVTEENRKLLESYADEKAWYAGGKSALSLAMAFEHFGMRAEAEKWLAIAKERDADVSNTDFMHQPVVTAGVIRGKVLLNGSPLAHTKVALISFASDRSKTDAYTIKDSSLNRLLVDAGETGKDGSFAFERLGSGGYIVAIMTDKNVIPFDEKPDSIKARNVPGVVQIGPAGQRNVGTIALSTK